MQIDEALEQRLLEKIRSLLPEEISRVEEFIDSLQPKNADYRLTLAFSKLSEPILEKIWDNPDDAEYDKL